MIHRQDDTFIIDFNNMPYHLTPEVEPKEGMYKAILAQYKAKPKEFKEESPYVPTEKEKVKVEIAQLKHELTETDYKALKFIEGEYTDKEFELIKKQRANVRKRIKELESQIKNI